MRVLHDSQLMCVAQLIECWTYVLKVVGSVPAVTNTLWAPYLNCLSLPRCEMGSCLNMVLLVRGRLCADYSRLHQDSTK